MHLVPAGEEGVDEANEEVERPDPTAVGVAAHHQAHAGRRRNLDPPRGVGKEDSRGRGAPSERPPESVAALAGAPLTVETVHPRNHEPRADLDRGTGSSAAPCLAAV